MFSRDVARILECLRQSPSLLKRLRGDDPRQECLKQLTTAADFRVVPALLPFLAANDSQSGDVARTIAELVSHVGPTDLGWIDEQARRCSYGYRPLPDAWWILPPPAVPLLARVAAAYPAAVGVLASHPNGYVREAAVKELAKLTDGREIPFLALRANDWVWPVAARAGELMSRRLVQENRDAVLTALPFIVRMLGQRRQDHNHLSNALRAALTSDGGRGVLARINRFDTPVRRFVYELLASEATAADNAVMRAALSDGDAVVRRSATRWLAATADLEASVAALEQVVSVDRVPIVRKEALTVLAERVPDRVVRLLPRVLLDPAPRVRELARFLVRALQTPINPRALYVENLKSASSSRLAAAIDGVAETGTGADASLLDGFHDSAAPRVRRAALRARARLDVERGVPLAIAALSDGASSVRATAAALLRDNARLVDFELVKGHLQRPRDVRTRLRVLSLLSEAPKWKSAEFLLEALGDSEPEVQQRASQLLDSWTMHFNRTQVGPSRTQVERIRMLVGAHESEMSKQTAELLRFSLKDLS